MSNINIDRQFKKIEVSRELKVKISFDEIFTLPAIAEGGESRTKVRKHTVTCDDVPHTDLLELMKKLKPHAFDINEMDHPETKKKQDYQICMVQVDGDIVLQKSRVKFMLGKRVPRTEKVIKIGPTGQVTMYGESDYADAEKMSKIIEELIEEIWLYLGGKFAPESALDGEQLPIFSPLQLQLDAA